MEKFGIFELLDALSALAAADTDGDKTPPAPPSADDAAYKPPAYTAEGGASDEQNGALADLLARHDALSKKIDGKK